MWNRLDKRMKVILVVGAALLVLALLALGLSGRKEVPVGGTQQSGVSTESTCGQQAQQGASGTEVGAEGSERPVAGSEGQGTGDVATTESGGTNGSTGGVGTMPGSDTQGSAGSQDSGSSESTEETVEVIIRVDAPYEKWMAAAQAIAVSIQYPDFDIEHIYLTGETELSDRMSSAGCYMVVLTGGQRIVLHSAPLSEERDAAGTIDVYTEEIGFNSFDVVSESGVDFGSMTEVDIEELTEVIEQSVLVTMYEH